MNRRPMSHARCRYILTIHTQTAVLAIALTAAATAAAVLLVVAYLTY
jgi:hypothetical protein